MDIATILQIAGAAIQVGKAAFEAGRDAWPFIQTIGKTLSKTPAEITEADLKELQDWSDKLSAELDAPLPSEGA